MVEARKRLREQGRKWYALHDKLTDARNMNEAWRQVEANRGAPGISGETVEEYGKNATERLEELGRRLWAGNFRARPIRQKLIPKTDGSGKMRELGIPEVEDRIVQAAIVRLIEPIFEDKFLDGSFGFRPERSAHHALQRVEAAIGADKPFVVDADIRNCFGSIPHEALIDQVATEVADTKLLGLVRSFVEADVVSEMESWTPERGTPQGAVLSPLLANIYLHTFDVRMAGAGYEVVRYADDFVVLCRTQEEAEAAMAKAEEILGSMGLLVHPEKSRVVDARTAQFQFLGYVFGSGTRWPRNSSLAKLRDGVRTKTSRSGGEAMRVVIKKVNWTLRGWYGYFKHSTGRVFGEVDGFVRRRLRSILRQYDGRSGAARNGNDNLRYPNAYFQALDLFSMSSEHAKRRRGRRHILFPAKA
jgi:RNA-directed DNA polymerase